MRKLLHLHVFLPFFPFWFYVFPFSFSCCFLCFGFVLAGVVDVCAIGVFVGMVVIGVGVDIVVV